MGDNIFAKIITIIKDKLNTIFSKNKVKLLNSSKENLGENNKVDSDINSKRGSKDLDFRKRITSNSIETDDEKEKKTTQNNKHQQEKNRIFELMKKIKENTIDMLEISNEDLERIEIMFSQELKMLEVENKKIDEQNKKLEEEINRAKSKIRDSKKIKSGDDEVSDKIDEILGLVYDGKVNSIDELQEMGYDIDKIFEGHIQERRMLNIWIRANKREQEK